MGNDMKYKVCVDAGHGGTDPGAVNGALYEKSVALDVATRLEKLLLAAGYDVIMTRKSDVYSTPKQKAEAANKSKADIFVSIHMNSSTSEDANGTETLTFDEDGMSCFLGKCIQEMVIQRVGLKDRGVKVRKDLIVLNSTTMPAVLVEAAFISNPNEKLLLTKAETKKKIAEGIFYGIEAYFGKAKMTVNEAESVVKERFGFDDNTMMYLKFYKFGDELILRLAEK